MDYFHTSDSSQLSGTNPFTRPNEFEFDPDPINWGHGTEAAEADAYSSTLLDDNALFQTTSHAETPLPRPQLPIGWDDLTVGSQWITLKILCDSGLNKKARVKQGFSSIVTANLRLSRVQIQRFLAKYMEQYEAWAHWKETSSNIAWDKLLECAANANMSVMDLLPQDRPQLSTDRISREEVDAAAKFLQSKHLDQYAGKLSEWVGINVHGDFLGLRIESELLRDHLDWKLLKKAHELGWIDMEVLEKKYEDVCQRDGRTDRVPREVFSFFRGDNTQAAGVPSIGPSSSNGTQAKRSRKKATTSDDNTTGNSGENANKSKARCSDGPCLNENSSPVQRPSNKELAEVRSALKRQFLGHLQSHVSVKAVFAPVKCPLVRHPVKRAANNSGYQPKARDTVILSESPNTASLQPPSTTEDKSGALNTRGSIVQASNKLSEASVGNLSNGYRSLKAGVVNDSAILNSSVSKITQNSPHHDNSHKDGPSTNATAVTSTPDREGVAAPTGRGSRTRAQGAEGCDTTASSQLREALDTRYAGYLDTPVSSSKLPRRERKPSRRARDGRSHPDFPTSDTDDGDYAPGRERVHQRKRIRLFSKRYESNSDEEDTPYEDKGQKQPRARRATVSSNARASKRERGQRPAERKTKKVHHSSSPLCSVHTAD